MVDMAIHTSSGIIGVIIVPNNNNLCTLFNMGHFYYKLF